MLRAPDEGDTSVVNYVIGSNVADLTITLPTVLSQSRDRLDTVFSIMGECVENDMEPVRMIDGLLVHNAITVEERESWEPILSSTYARVLDLHRRNWNGIWFRIVRNYFWSSTAGEFEVIVAIPRGSAGQSYQNCIGTEWLLHAVNMIFSHVHLITAGMSWTFLDLSPTQSLTNGSEVVGN